MLVNEMAGQLTVIKDLHKTRRIRFSHRWRKSILLIIACRNDLLSSAGRAVSLWVAYPGLLPQNVHMQYDDDPAQAPDLMLLILRHDRAVRGLRGSHILPCIT